MSTANEASSIAANGRLQSASANVKDLFTSAIKKAFPDVTDHETAFGLADPKHGDFQCNSAMALHKKHKGQLGEGMTSPKAIGEKIRDNVPENALIDSVTVAPQGFVTVRISPKWLTKELIGAWHSGIKHKAAGSEKPKKVIVDFSSPNIAKEMHVGHLRSTILGECICRIFEFCGEDVSRVNHVGDWGTQFGMLIEHLKEAYPDFHDNPPEISDLQQFYKASKVRFDEDADFKKRSTDMVVKLQGGDPYAREAWQLFCDISRKEFQKIYDRLDVTLTEFGESYYNDMIPDTVKELEEKKLVVDHDGAKMIFTDIGSEAPMIAVKSDGGYGYDSTDLAAVRYRLLELHGERLVYITDAGQCDHFQKLFWSAKKAGWTDKGQQLDHVEFGVIQGEDGKKFKTRSGTTVKLSDLIDEAKNRALLELKSREKEASDAGPKDDSGDSKAVQGKKDDVSPEEAAERIGCAAIKYFDLKNCRVSDYKFSFDRMLDNKGNTAVYMLYAYARISQILAKASPEDVAKLDAATDLDLSTEATTLSEKTLALTLLRFPDVIDSILVDLMPHRLCEFMYDISVKFTDFYKNCKVIGAPEQAQRLVLCELTRRMLKTAFDLMGIKALNRL